MSKTIPPRFNMMPFGVDVNGQSIRIAIEDRYTGDACILSLSLTEHNHALALKKDRIKELEAALTDIMKYEPDKGMVKLMPERAILEIYALARTALKEKIL